MRRLAAAASAAAALLCFSAIPAQAAQASHFTPFTRGKVLTHHGGVMRAGPATTYAVSGHLRNGQIVPLLCKATGQSVRGHRLWYKLNDRPEMWASSLLIGHIGKGPLWCTSQQLSAHAKHHAKKHHAGQHGVKQQAHHPLVPQSPQVTPGPQSSPSAQNAQSAQNAGNQQLSQQELQKLQRELLKGQVQKKPLSVPGLPHQVGGNG